MRAHIAWTLTLIAGAWTAGPLAAQGQQAAPGRASARAPAPASAPTKGTPAAPAPAKVDAGAVQAQQVDQKKAWEDMNKLLAEWEAKSRKITSIYVAFDREDSSVAWGKKYYKGSAILRSPDLACLEFRRCVVDADGKPVTKPDAAGKPQMQLEKDPSERIVCTGKEVLQHAYDEKVVYIYPLAPEVRQKTLQQGPLPFLFNMKAAEAKARYGMSVLKENDQEYLIRILPKEQIDRSSFEEAWLWLNKKDFLPNRLRLTEVGGKTRQDFLFTVMRPNQTVADEYFQATITPGWQVKRNTDDQAQGVAPANATAPAPATSRRPVQKPAMRPANPPR